MAHEPTTKRSARVLGGAFVAATFALATAPVHADPAPPAPPRACVAIRAEARYGAAGYNHVVVLANACAQDEACTVTTDVNPEPQRVLVPARASTEVVTFLGSPARVFVPKAVCAPIKK